MTMVYIKGNWFVIPLAINVLGTEFPKYPSLVRESASTWNNVFCLSVQELGLFSMSDLLKRPPNLNKFTSILPNKRFPFSQYFGLHC